ncbi:hypothetical protein EVJ32_04715 [Exiguobacterium sp. SH5S4]|uniref:phage lytic cycle repressor MrpR family protein n=1 Tax=Exiguobacterium sp. SH5S4 TaxID=2510961 RepID=UPI00103E978C|nr:hypothetical protein [Exiguobacterium sp. SH5S4]TCI26680.1 hypothetical protein EVJ32_04715 [Exiguobacterium sp. SH5S4]
MTNLENFETNKQKLLDDDLFYNAEYKLDFLDKHKTKTQDFNFYYRLFINVKEKEESLGRDMYDFSRRDIEDVVSGMHPSTSSAAAKIIAMIKRYLTHAAQDGEKSSNIVHQVGKLTDMANSFLPSNPKFYVSEAELQLLEDSCMNPQDAFIFRAIFEGVLGAEMTELRNLKMSDIDIHQNLVSINIADYNKNRTIRVTERFIDMAVKAYEQKVYILNNGEDVSENFMRANTEYELEDSGYIMKKSHIGRMIKDAPITTPTLYKRFNNIKAFQSFETIDKYYLKFNNIYKSGAIWYGARYIEEKQIAIKKLTDDHMKEVARHVKNVYQDLPVDIKKIVNVENIEELYVEKGKIIS